jgi:hypothetical protein
MHFCYPQLKPMPTQCARHRRKTQLTTQSTAKTACVRDCGALEEPRMRSPTGSKKQLTQQCERLPRLRGSCRDCGSPNVYPAIPNVYRDCGRKLITPTASPATAVAATMSMSPTTAVNCRNPSVCNFSIRYPVTWSVTTFRFSW